MFKIRTVGIEIDKFFFHQITWNDVCSVTFVFRICLRAASANYDKSCLLEPFLFFCNEMLKLISRSAGTRAFKITLSEEKLITFFMLCNAVIFTDSQTASWKSQVIGNQSPWCFYLRDQSLRLIVWRTH